MNEDTATARWLTPEEYFAYMGGCYYSAGAPGLRKRERSAALLKDVAEKFGYNLGGADNGSTRTGS